MSQMRVLGIVGWSGSGKTVLITRLLPMLAARGLRVATLKHAHHAFDVDKPGKDSYEHRKAGAREVIISSARRWAQMHEIDQEREQEATLSELLRRVSPCDLVLIEGFKREQHPKLEVFRHAASQSPMYPLDPRIVVIASDQPLPESGLPTVDLNDTAAVARAVCELAEPMQSVLEALERPARSDPSHTPKTPLPR